MGRRIASSENQESSAVEQFAGLKELDLDAIAF
jgi:hypothetical protein